MMHSKIYCNRTISHLVSYFYWEVIYNESSGGAMVLWISAYGFTLIATDVAFSHFQIPIHTVMTVAQKCDAEAVRLTTGWKFCFVKGQKISLDRDNPCWIGIINEVRLLLSNSLWRNSDDCCTLKYLIYIYTKIHTLVFITPGDW